MAELGFWTVHGHPASIAGQIQAFASSFALILIGVYTAGPWPTMAAARGMARWTSHAGTLIASRRLADDPQGAFRAVSGLVLALFITTVAVVAISTQNARNVTRFGTVAESNVLTDQVTMAQGPSGSRDMSGTGRVPATGTAAPAAPAAPLTARLRAVPGVQGVVVIRAVPGLTIPGTFHGIGGNGFGPPSSSVPAGVMSCVQLATVPALGRCPAGATAAAFPAAGFGINDLLGFGDTTAITWPAANVPAARLDSLGVDAIAVATDGSTAAVEDARTLLENSHAYPAPNVPSTIGLHPDGRHRRRARRPQAAVQPAAAGRRPARHAAPRRRAGRRRPAAHRGRHHRVPRHHRRHLPAPGPHHRPGDSQKRMTQGARAAAKASRAPSVSG